MAETAQPGTWVEIATIVLTPGERAPEVPEDTRQVPLEMRVKGFLAHAAVVSEDAEIITVSGRRLRGRLVAVNPPYSHGFGAPIPALLGIGGELRALLAGASGDASRDRIDTP
jgi:hypothetical protein